jgi:hypothetical protein
MARFRDWLLTRPKGYPNTIPAALFCVGSVIGLYTALAWGFVWLLTRPSVPWLPHHQPEPFGWRLFWDLFVLGVLGSFLWQRRRPHRIARP